MGLQGHRGHLHLEGPRGFLLHLPVLQCSALDKHGPVQWSEINLVTWDPGQKCPSHPPSLSLGLQSRGRKERRRP